MDGQAKQVAASEQVGIADAAPPGGAGLGGVGPHELGPHELGPHGVGLRRRLFWIFAALIAGNAAAWLWAALALRATPALMGTALLAYTFGLRHAVDADHIAAIDNVTRKLMRRGQRPVAVGLFFSLGHSTVVCLLTAAVVGASAAVLPRFAVLKDVGGLVGTGASALFLFAIAGTNAVVLVSVVRTLRAVKRGAPHRAQDHDLLLDNRGGMARLLRPLFGLVTRSRHCLLVGFLFGLGFDTATEIALFGIAGAQAAHGLAAAMVFPALFTAGMALVDTADGVLMLGAYGWTTGVPVRRLRYDVAVTGLSVILAVAVGGIEVLGLVGERFERQGRFWGVVGRLNDGFGVVGASVVGLFAALWLAAILVGRLRRVEAPAGSTP